MITISGRDVSLCNREAPTLYDIGYSLSQVPRFGGHIIRRWTVLHHLYAAGFYADLAGYTVRTKLYLVLHDAHESITSDVPHPWKTEDLKRLQVDLDLRLWSSLGIGSPSRDIEITVHSIDNQLVYHEAKTFAPQVAEAIVTPGHNYRDGINRIDPHAERAIKQAEEWLEGMSPPDCAFDYEQHVESLLEKVR